MDVNNGHTYDLSGHKLSKNDVLMHFQGAADELNAHLGLVKAMHPDENIRRSIEKIQTNVSTLMAHVSDIHNDKYIMPDDEPAALKSETGRLFENLPKRFALPGKSVLEAQTQIARAVARRAERHLVAVSENYPVSENALSYLNTLSDYLFALSQEEFLGAVPAKSSTKQESYP